MLRKYCNLYWDEPVKTWDEALPLGCGKEGTLIWGDGAPLNLSIDRGDLWDNRLAGIALGENYNFPYLRKCVENGEIEEIHKTFERPPSFIPTKLPPTRVLLDFGACASKMNMQLDLSRAEGSVLINFLDGEKTRIEAIEHAESFCGAIKIHGKLPKISIRLPDYTPKPDDTFRSLGCLNYPTGRISKKSDGNMMIYTAYQETICDLTYAFVIITKQTKNTMEAVYTVASDKDGEKWLDETVKKLKNELKKGYDKLLLTHIKWWKSFWNESSISIPCDKKIERLWYINNYYLGSASRPGFLPMPLQGVWTADHDELPPWRGDYHNNQNVQQTYNSYPASNHMKAGMAMIELLQNTRDAGRKYAQKFYKTKGLSLPPSMTPLGDVVTGWVTVTGMPTNHLWLCRIMEKHGLFCADDTFLRKVSYPYFVESAECILELLEEKDGKLYLPLSTSPEHYENTLKAWLKPNSNFDLACLRYFFGALKNMAKTLGYKKELMRWEEIFEKLPYYDTLENGELTIAEDEPMLETYLHHGHAMAIFPFSELDDRKPEDKRIMEATIFRLEVLGTGKWVGYSYPWMASIYTRVHRGEAARYQLNIFADCFCGKNGFNLNGDFSLRGVSGFRYRPFTLEGNLAAADAIQEMLMQSHKDVIEIFPAIPDSWAKNGVSFKTLRAKGGFLISAKMENRKLTYLKIKSEGERTLRIEVNMENPTVTCSKALNDYKIENGILTANMKSGEWIALK